jgi:hypothetical protein
MTQKLSPDLRAIYDLELMLGNALLRVDDSPHTAFPLTVYLKEPLHREQVESTLEIKPPIEWQSDDMFAGYVSEDTRQSVNGPIPPLAELLRNALEHFAPNLRAIYDLEISLGNLVQEVDEPAGDRCPLAIVFKRPMHRATIESKLSLPAVVKWWECRDPHYPIQGGYSCEETHHVIAGPLT